MSVKQVPTVGKDNQTLQGGYKSLASIACERGVSLSALKRHAAYHMPRFLRVSAKVFEVSEGGRVFRAITIKGEDDKRTAIKLDAYIKLLSGRYKVCETPEQLVIGKTHSQKVREHDPAYWPELVKMAEDACPGMKVVQ